MSDASDDLYSRQTALSLYKYDHAIVVGLGGIGNWVALDLALSGQVGVIHLIDPDTVEESNLNRTIFRYCDIGRHKVDAVKFQILERRSSVVVKTYKELTNEKLLERLLRETIDDNSIYNPFTLIMDCRDDIFDDLYDFNCKLYKCGYDGTSMTIDGNPRLTKVFTQRGGSYSIIPSYIGSSQIVAAIAVNDALCAGFDDSRRHSINAMEVSSMPYISQQSNNGRDEHGRLNRCITIKCEDMLMKCSDGDIGQYDSRITEQEVRTEFETETGDLNDATE